MSLLSPRWQPLARFTARVAGPIAFLRGLTAIGRAREADECLGDPELAVYLYVLTESPDRMLRCLRREVLNRHGWYIAVEPLYDPYREDPRFIEILQMAGYDASGKRQPRTAVSTGTMGGD